MEVGKVRMAGFLMDIRCTSEENLVVEVDCTKLLWSEYKALIEDLED